MNKLLAVHEHDVIAFKYLNGEINLVLLTFTTVKLINLPILVWDAHGSVHSFSSTSWSLGHAYIIAGQIQWAFCQVPLTLNFPPSNTILAC